MLPKHKNYELMDMCEVLTGLEEYAGLTEMQKTICFNHVTEPALNKSELAMRSGCDRGTVYAFLNSQKWHVLNQELAKQQLRELVQLSIKTLKSSMLTGTSAVRLDAATRVLVNAGLLISPHGKSTINKTDNKMVVVFEESLSGNPNTVYPASETAGSPRLDGAIPGDRGRTSVGEDNASRQ